jgi:hypothetical protein
MLEFQKMELIGNVMKFTIADLKKELGKRTKEEPSSTAPNLI